MQLHTYLNYGGNCEQAETFFASRFAMLRDKFGASWMLLHSKAQSATAA